MANIEAVPPTQETPTQETPTEDTPPPPAHVPEPVQQQPFEGLAREQVSEMLRLPHFGRRGALVAVGLLAVLWAASGFYRVQPDEQGIVLRFGKWVATEPSGVHYHWPYPVETILLPKTTQINQMVLGSRDGRRERSQMLTGDENIVEVDCVVFWRIRDAGQFLFNVADAEGTLRVSAESALREVIGQNPIQAALSDKRQQIAQQTKVVLQRLLDKYQAGIVITQVQLLRIDPPAAVIDAFNDVQRARADQERARNEAEAYRNDILPRARGEAERIVQEAQAYGEQAVDLAKGEAQSFLAVEAAYERHKDVTLRRLYLEGVDEVLKHSGRVIVDLSAHGSSIVPYLPLTEAEKRAVPLPAPPVADQASTGGAK
ncbi:FtsH protease activity modulator HflK [Xanthobacter sp.]|uniref:FtsH protease activity modulator HflK n=1 Tax=Xanthobacter sp. TaxID=35809 RepID=UPI0025F2A9C0|nr:FtsH protease activity modulator HflK [Xanthobacter sp.]